MIKCVKGWTGQDVSLIILSVITFTFMMTSVVITADNNESGSQEVGATIVDFYERAGLVGRQSQRE